MSVTDQKKLDRFMSGFTEGDEMQEPPGSDWDNQLVALTQFFQTLKDAFRSDDIVLDVGSGRGIVAHHALLRIWPNGNDGMPWYYAVDLEKILDTLALPRQIHNHSLKMPFDDFLGARFPCPLNQIKVVVLRNVIHELNIRTTAEVLIALRKIARSGGQIYLQDIVSLAKGERENAGWPSDLLQTVLRKLGFDCGSPDIRKSYTGIEWFTMILKDKSGHSVPSIADATRVVTEGRQQQIQRRANRLTELRESTPETTTEYFILATEIGALTTQLQQTQYATMTAGSGMRFVAELPLTQLQASTLDYAEEMPDYVRAKSGLSGILSSKNLIDLPTLVRRAVNRLWFAGYSQRLLFKIPEVREALKDAAQKGIDIRILLVDPKSPAALARSISKLYAKPDDFFEDIRLTTEGFAAFTEELSVEIDGSNRISCDLRFCESILSSSFFFVDDLCICSLYSPNLSGGAGGTFVFKSSSIQLNGYFQVLLNEFQSAWNEMKN